MKTPADLDRIAKERKLAVPRDRASSCPIEPIDGLGPQPELAAHACSA